MNRDSEYFKRAHLLLRMIPHVAKEKCFALKGGTAINFFVRDMPRLSVDIDLTYLPVGPRDASLRKISEALHRIASSIQKTHSNIKVQESEVAGRTTKLLVNENGVRIIIEPNEVIRGVVFGVEERTLTSEVEKTFELFAEIQVLSLPDLYGGKLCAALDRQHPRDVFDIKLLIENEGITPEIQRAFVIYLSGHDRPIHELIEPNRIDMANVYKSEFAGMTSMSVSYEELLSVREKYISVLSHGLTADERRFLISLKEGSPLWNLLAIDGVERLPSLQWKLVNIKKLSVAKHMEQLQKLKVKLGLTEE